MVGRHPGDPQVAEGRALPQCDTAHLAQLEQGQEAHDDLDAGLQPATSERNDVARSASRHGDQVGHRFGDRKGVHRDVGEVDPGHRTLGRAPEVGLRQILGGDAGQQVRCVDHEVVVEAHLAGMERDACSAMATKTSAAAA